MQRREGRTGREEEESRVGSCLLHWERGVDDEHQAVGIDGGRPHGMHHQIVQLVGHHWDDPRRIVQHNLAHSVKA